MLDKTEDISLATANWLGQFESALRNSDSEALQALFQRDSYWRDVLALSWRMQTLNGADAILEQLPAHARRAAPARAILLTRFSRAELARPAQGVARLRRPRS